MDFFPNPDQEAILASIDVIVARHGGSQRLRALGGDEPLYDHELDKHLTEAGFLDLAQPGQTDRLDAALVAEALARGLASTSGALRALVAPSVGISNGAPLAICTSGHIGPLRFGADAEAIVVVGADEVRLIHPKPGAVPRAPSRMGWPVGELPEELPTGDAVAADPDDVRSWWCVALAVELVGTMALALDLTVSHVTDRQQFGRPIGSFQAVQHGLAECAVLLEGARWLAREAAWSGSPELALAALTHTMGASTRVMRDCHQYTGALGFTTEYDLHLATMRIPALRAEGASAGRPAVALARTHWGLSG